MASLNPLTRELVFKIVFYGPGLGGKTTTLQYIHATAKPENRGKMVSLATPTDRTLYFDFLPVRVQRVRNMNVRLQLFTVPGQVYYSATRKLVLTGADGLVFVADSQAGRIDANQESLEDLNTNLAEHGRSLSQIPHTFHWNKRDLSDVVATDELDRRFNLFSAPSLGTVATRGDGVFEGLEQITKLVLMAYKAELPRGGRDLAVLLDADALGLTEAIRGLAEAPLSIKSPTITRTHDPHEETRAPPSMGSELPEDRPLSAPAAQPTVTSPPPAYFSFADFWPEAERDSVRRAESLIGARDATSAVLACDVLLTRVLASAAGLAGTMDAPRDPALVSLLLGLDGQRYLAFRAAVRSARQKEDVTVRDALECFTFALEARRARDVVVR